MTSQVLLLLVCLTSMTWAEIPNGQKMQSLPTISVLSPVSSPSLLEGLKNHGAIVFTDLGEDYTKAIEKMTEKAPSCLDGALQVKMDDGSQRFTLARDTISSTHPFPDCLVKEATKITAAFDQVDHVFSKVLKQIFGAKLDVHDPEENKVTPWDDYNSKTHLHIYSRSEQPNNATFMLPYHTDNGLYVLLTPSDNLPLRSISSDGSVNLFPGKDSVILILGTGLTQWLLPDEDLYAAPHALPALSNSLTPAPRTVMARMKVAPPRSVPHAGSKMSFDSHFSAPFETESGPTLARLRKQRSAEPGNDLSQCSQSWTHACGCVLPGVQFVWHNGELGERQNVKGQTQCQLACSGTGGCFGWTYNTNNGWCGFRTSNQIKKAPNSGFVSGVLDSSSRFC